MNVLKRVILLGGMMAALTISNQAMAQRGGDPSQYVQDRVDRTRDQLEITNDTEWKAIEPLVSKVVNAQMTAMRLRMSGMFGRRPRPGADNGNSDRPTRSSRFGEPSAAMAALQKAIDDKAPTSELKAKMAAVRAEIKDADAKLEAAQSDLVAVLSTRQEAIAVAHGLVK